MSQQKEAIDLMNVEYDDVLNLYRGWKKSEGALRDKNKELATLKGRIAQLQESHNKFRNQIHALESVKELTVTLQNKLSILEQENKQLATENRELAELNLQAEDILKEKSSSEEVHSNTLRDVQLEFANLRGRYEETIKAQQELEKLAADEQAMRLSAESRLLSSNESIDQLREENRVLSQKLESAVLRMNQCDHELAHASEQLSSLSKELSSVKTNQTKMSTLEAENGLLKGDISRLIRLLEKSPETSGFIASWQDSGGLDFIGIDRNISGVNRTDQSHNHLEHSDTVWQSIANGSKYGASESNLGDLTPGEFAHLRRIHGEDPFPMTANLSVSRVEISASVPFLLN